jgi:hypothetical protein
MDQDVIFVLLAHTVLVVETSVLQLNVLLVRQLPLALPVQLEIAHYVTKISSQLGEILLVSDVEMVHTHRMIALYACLFNVSQDINQT